MQKEKNAQNTGCILMQWHSGTEKGEYLEQIVLWPNRKELASDWSYLFCTADVIFPEGCSILGTSSIQSQSHKDVHLKQEKRLHTFPKNSSLHRALQKICILKDAS